MGNFQVTETYMTKEGFRVFIADNEDKQDVTFSAQFMDDIVEKWQKIKNGEQSVAVSRHYTHEWPKLVKDFMEQK